MFARKGTFNSIALLVGLALMTVITVWDWKESDAVGKQAATLSTLADFAERIKADADAQAEAVPPLQVRMASLKSALSAQLDVIQAALAKTDKFPEQVALVEDITQAVSAIERHRRLAFNREPAQGIEFLPPLAQAINGLAGSWREWLDVDYQHSQIKHFYKFLYDGLFVALGSAMFSLLGFYIASAAYRAFRIRSTESALMMLAALLVMLGQIPFGIWLWDQFPAIRLWLLTVPNSAAFRAIELGAAIAGLIMAFRMWLSIESESFTKR